MKTGHPTKLRGTKDFSGKVNPMGELDAWRYAEKVRVKRLRCE
jgi:hypothetical protein